MTESIGLKELVQRTVNDLLEVERERESNGKGRLHVREVVFEINTIAVEKTGATGGFDLKVLTVGGDIVDEQRYIHKIIVKATTNSNVSFPMAADGGLA